ncbi:MAG: TonB-dependent receptor [Pseudomonadaceae bacterium]|nr:TonB-dependent receptor [Pseudomonadaceae bacterium]
MSYFRIGGAALLCMLFANQVLAEEKRRVIEEMVVTAEKRESTVSDTSISITAFGEDMIEDFGIQGADELVNFIPATTRDAYDIRIRGVGRNFRAVGGDPGVATYYNGVYSEDFGIAASENGLYDIARIEALRGPQGTLYGRNSIGGALNYITNKPTYEFEGELRVLGGNLGAQEYYGVLSGPIIEDKLAYRIVGVNRDRDGAQGGLAGSEDINSIHDSNYSISLQWNIADNWEANVRWNDRSSDRIIGMSTVVAQGFAGDRDTVNTENYARGIRPVTAGTPGATAFTHPVTGETLYGAYNRPGVDIAQSAVPNSGFGLGGQGLALDPDLEDLNAKVANNGDNFETFDQNGVQFDLTWDLSETTAIKYLGGWSDFDYLFDIDLDYTNGTFSQPRQTVTESVETYSHELQLLWQLGDKLQVTSGLYYFHANRVQNYAFRDRESQGRFLNAANYGVFDPLLPATHTRRGDAAVGTQEIGRWSGDPTGAYYEYWNEIDTDAYAVYTQGTYTFNEEFALTIGVRWAEDEKSAFEDRTGYFELDPINFGVDLATANLAMGNAFPTGDPDNPIGGLCALTDPACTTPLRLQGIPYSFADAAKGEDDWGDTSFRVNLDWTPNADTLVYASVTTGYRAGGYSLGIGDSRGLSAGGIAGIVPLTYDQEEVLATEIGYKATLLEGQLQINSSVYMYQYDGYQDRIEIFNAAAGQAQDQVLNTDDVENMGVEVEFTWLPTDALTLGGNVSYTKTEYKSDLFVLEDDNPNFPVQIFNQTAADPVTGAPGRDAFLAQNLKGNELKRIPEWKYTLWGSYQWNFEAGTLTAGGTFSYTGEYASEGIIRAIDENPARERLDVSLTWRDNRDQWVVRGFVDNVLDKVYSRGITTGTASGDWRQLAQPLYPQFYGLEVTYRFGAF